ncbi:MAG: GHKL domain-containing protein [Oscillospiraceae bacterium]|nr:GHKL domain-containing protein [Oscillospiraceae bacterium]
MKNSIKRQNSEKWMPLIALPIMLIVGFLVWRAFEPFAGAGAPAPSGFPVTVEIGAYAALFLVHLVLFFALREYKANLVFVGVCFVFLLFFTSETLLPSGAVLSFILEYLSMPAMLLLILGIIHTLFPRILQKWFIITFIAVIAAITIANILFDYELFSTIFTVFSWVVSAAAIYVAVRFVIKLRHINPEHVAFLLGFAILMFGVLFTLLWDNINLPLGFLFIYFNFILLFLFFTSAALVMATARKILEANADRQRLEAQNIITENQLDYQREQYGRLMENVETARYMRHDMKHHLAVISEYVAADNLSGINGYLEGLELGLTKARGKIYCENYAVNAIVNHYLGTAENDGVRVKVKLTVPAEAGQVRDSDLCVIVGNILENAVEACRHTPKSERFIRLFSYVQDGVLTFTLENSFDGEIKEWGGIFYSTKRDGEGIGLSSVAAVAGRYNGAARFEVEENTFLSSVYVDMLEI